MSDKKIIPILSTALMALCLSLPAYADEDITRKIWQEAQHNQQENENRLITPDPVFVEYNSSYIVLNGKTFQVGNNINDIGQALFLAINHRQWPDVRRFLAAYLKLPGYDVMLVNFAQGGLARLEGDLDLATYHYQQILNQQPDFPRIKLELARIYFEDHKNRESEQLFSELSENQQLPEAVSKNINSYLEAIDLRNSWRGSFSAGYAYNDNVNMSPDQDIIYQSYDPKTKLIYLGQIPKAVKAWGISYDATLNRRYQLSGHHGIFGRGLIYGENYRNFHDENEDTFLLTGGYNYKNKRHDFSFGPLFEYKQRADDAGYRAMGAKTEWRWAFTSQTSLNVELEHKQLRHQQRFRRKDGGFTSSYLTLSHAINKDFALFGGGDWLYRGNDQYPIDRYQQWGLRAGIAGQLYPGITGSLFATLKERRFGAYNPMLKATRQDTEQIYTAVIKVPSAEILGMTPSLTFRHRRNHSNVNWLYSYNKNEVLIRLEKYF
ncbi:porin family protein [Xenorhabdus sp. Sc-CR9]|uniref:porin family protein n=1 Tax=Xenorhabdus sp. Sc-CR9 TaxID=2584468 RepID=UPI001F2237F1|nr:porin family protein [Xenorhabdus sp. Sc-CR9]